MEAEERRRAGFDEEDEVVMPLPVYSSSDDDDGVDTFQPADVHATNGANGAPESARERMQRLLEQMADGCCATAPTLLEVSFWRNLGAEEGLHVCADPLHEDGAADATLADPSIQQADTLQADTLQAHLLQADTLQADALQADTLQAEAPHTLSDSDDRSLRCSLEQRGYFVSGPALHPAAASDGRLARMTQRLREQGFAPAFIFMYDEAWEVLQQSWLLSATLLGAPASELVLEASFHAHALRSGAERAAAADAEAADGEAGVELKRYAEVGGQFGLPHRDHSTRECLDAEGRATMLSIWCPLTDVAADNGCMHVLPKSADALFRSPEHPHHLSPYEQRSRRLHFELAATVALAPCAAGSTLGWHGSLVHWGGQCADHAKLPPRVSLTATLRLRESECTALQTAQRLPPLELEQLPLSLEMRIRYVAANLLLYKWWFPLGRGVVPEEMINGAWGGVKITDAKVRRERNEREMRDRSETFAMHILESRESSHSSTHPMRVCVRRPVPLPQWPQLSWMHSATLALSALLLKVTPPHVWSSRSAEMRTNLVLWDGGPLGRCVALKHANPFRSVRTRAHLRASRPLPQACYSSILISDPFDTRDALRISRRSKTCVV